MSSNYWYDIDLLESNGYRFERQGRVHVVFAPNQEIPKAIAFRETEEQAVKYALEHYKGN